MAAKMLHTLADENPDLQKQIGCMTGIFQIFDRHQTLIGRRIGAQGHKRLPSGNLYNNGSLETEANNAYRVQVAAENNSSKNINEKQRISTESSRASFSSSSCSSSFSSSIDCNKPVHPEPSSLDRIIFPETPSRDPSMSQTSSSPRLSRQSLDLRDVVKESMYREARGLSMKTINKEEEEMSCVVKHRDSPRPFHLQNTPLDIKESLRVLAKLQEAPCYFKEAKDDFRRFSYDGREVNRYSFELRETLKPTSKINDLPRLSLDGREGFSRSNSPLRNSRRGSENSTDRASMERFEIQKRPPSVVAKLMGLEALPDAIKIYPDEDCDSVSRLSKVPESSKPFPNGNSPKNLRNDPNSPISPKWKSTHPTMKPVSSSRFPIEPAPWRHVEGGRGSRKPAFRDPKSPVARSQNSFNSVYSDIDKRLKDLEFKQSGKDLRALKQILEAMQAKGLLERRNEEPRYNGIDQNPRLVLQRNPITIIKPAKLIERTVIQIDGSTGVHKIQQPTNPQIQTRGKNRREPNVALTEKKPNSRNSRPTQQTATRVQNLPKENTASSTKISGSVSPRLQQKKGELERRARPPPTPDSSKPRRQPSRVPMELGSPGGKGRAQSQNSQHGDQLSETSGETRNFSYQGDDISLLSEGTISLDSKMDLEVTSADRSAETKGIKSPARNPVRNLSKHSTFGSTQKSTTTRLSSENRPAAELATTPSEQPSPVSVLHGLACKDDSPSPVKQIPKTFKDDEEQWNPSLTSEISRQKLQNIDHLVQKLRRLNSNHDESGTDYIASLCENTNPDHRYVSEILLASGLLLRDLTTFQLHSSGHPINPELFYVLEQTKASSILSKEERSPEKLHRKLIFDVVNDTLVGKLSADCEPRMKAHKLTRKPVKAQQILRELCAEIEQLQPKKLEPVAEDGFMKILWDDVMTRSEKWMNLEEEISGAVLDIERLIFKDLVNEIVIGEAGNFRAKPSSRRCRQLFSK